MNAKSIVSMALLAFVGVSVAYLIIRESQSQPAVPAAPQMHAAAPAPAPTPAGEPLSTQAAEQPAHKVIAYYFHRTQRCHTCLTIQAYAEQALREAFPKALERGELEWRAVNVEEPANEHFVAEYQLASSALVLVDTWNGEQKQWLNLEQVWDLVDDEPEFKFYVESEALTFLETDS